MYIAHAPGGRDDYSSFQGLSDGTTDSQQFQKSLAALRTALDLNPQTGYVKGSTPRKKLEEAFESVPVCSALEFAQQLLKSEGSLEKLFRHRLHPFTQQTMLKILLRKAKECQEQRKEELRRMEEAERRRDLEIRQMMCASLAQSDRLVAELCKRTGEGSDQCRTVRSNALKERERLLTQGFRCP